MRRRNPRGEIAQERERGRGRGCIRGKPAEFSSWHSCEHSCMNSRPGTRRSFTPQLQRSQLGNRVLINRLRADDVVLSKKLFCNTDLLKGCWIVCDFTVNSSFFIFKGLTFLHKFNKNYSKKWKETKRQVSPAENDPGSEEKLYETKLVQCVFWEFLKKLYKTMVHWQAMG